MGPDNSLNADATPPKLPHTNFLAYLEDHRKMRQVPKREEEGTNPSMYRSGYRPFSV